MLAANRDERLDRAWDAPAAWWPAHPGIVAGRDRTAGGTWMALGPAGVVATVLNRSGSLGPAEGKRSRGSLPLLGAGTPNAVTAVRVLAALPVAEWRPFNMVVADHESGFFLRGLGHGAVEAVPLPDGISLVTAQDPNDLTNPRTARHLPRFRAALPPVPEQQDWAGWEALLADAGGDPAARLRVPPTDGFGTVCSSVLALGAGGQRVWRFAPGPAGTATFAAVALP